MRSETLEQLVNALTTNYQYSRGNNDSLQLPIQMQLYEKLETFSSFFLAFFQSVGNFELFEQKISLIAQLFLKLLSPKDAFISIYKRSCFGKLVRVNVLTSP